MPRKSADQWFAEYGESHQNHANELIHWICVPAIFFSVLGFAWAIPVPAAWEPVVPWFNWSLVAIAAAFGFYAWLGCSVLFYLVTNSVSWLGDAYYAKTLAGWWQAMTVGHPEYPPTLWFFRNTLVGDLLFTGVFALVMARARVTKPQTA